MDRQSWADLTEEEFSETPWAPKLSRRRSRKGPNATILKAAWCLFVDIRCGRVEPSVAMARAKHLYTQSPPAAAQLRAWLIVRPPAREEKLVQRK